LSQFTDAAARRPDVVALRGRVRAEVDEHLATSACRATLTARDGRSWTEHVSAATGTPGNPMSDQDLIDKFRDLAASRFSTEALDELVSKALGAAHLQSVRALAIW